MEKEFKIAELAQLWGVSVPTAWNRIKKEGLKTFIKKNEIGKDINYVSVSEDILNKFNLNINKDIITPVNNGYYKEMLNDINVNNDVIDTEYTIKSNNTNQSLINDLINLNKGYNEELKNIYNDFQERLSTVNNELLNVNKELYETRGNLKLLEDKAGREGLYLKEINDLKSRLTTENNRNKLVINTLLTVLILLIMVIVGLLTWFITVKNVQNSVENVQNLPQKSLEFEGIKQ